MAEISASMVKELREMTGAGMMECKKALSEAEGDMEKAVDVLRTRGLAAVEKKAGRATNEGLVMTMLNDECTHGSVIELNCETDFVAMNDKFKAYAERIARAALECSPVDVENIKSATEGGETVEAILTDCIHVMGENCQISRVAEVEAPAVTSYIHAGGKVSACSSTSTSKASTLHPKASRSAGATLPCRWRRSIRFPQPASRSLPTWRPTSSKIYKAQAAESGKPENIQQKIAEGRMEKFYKENCLSEQDFVKNGDVTVREYVDSCAKELGGKYRHPGLHSLRARRVAETIAPSTRGRAQKARSRFGLGRTQECPCPRK